MNISENSVMKSQVHTKMLNICKINVVIEIENLWRIFYPKAELQIDITHYDKLHNKYILMTSLLTCKTLEF